MHNALLPESGNAIDTGGNVTVCGVSDGSCLLLPLGLGRLE